jgi:internalin A
MTDEELLQVIEQAAADEREVLDLSGKGLRSLPPEIEKLKKLRSLDLRFNPLNTLPPEIGQLTNLEVLYLWKNPLKDLPAEIGQLTNLRFLTLKFNLLSTLPAEIVKFIKLKSFHEWNRPLDTFPSEILQLTNLKSLDLSGNQISALPYEILQLANLQSIDLSNNRLRTLPSEILQLSNLKSLNLSGNQISILPSGIEYLTNLEYLDISLNPLRFLSTEIGQLTNLKSLILSSTPLSSLPAEIGQITNLQLLNLKNNQLKSLPEEILQLTNLQSLDLGDSQLNKLPAEVGHLTNLKSLGLKGNRLRTLPSEILQLTNLQSLDLGLNPLSSLSAEIGQLTHLQFLILSNTLLSSLPAEIGQLINLQSLDISNTPLSSLPTEIGQLINLQSLDIRNNQLSDLPAEIGQLINLQSLDIRYNQLSSLPAEIGRLINLQSLDIRYNQLSSLPAEIGALKNLKQLYVEDNRLAALPPEIGKLRLSNVGLLRGNPLESLPPEIRRKGYKAVINFYKQFEQATDRLYEAKLLILGEGGAGKTSLAKKIKDSNYQLQSSETSTEGIDIIQYSFSLEQDKEFKVNIWDFGGQEIYHATHQFFLTKRSLYILVADTRKEDTDFYYWLSIIKLLSDDSPVIIVNNEKQERKREINDRQLRGEFSNLKETRATNLETNRGLPEILETLKYYLNQLPHVGTELPKSWLKVRAELEQDSRNYITLENYLEICQANGFDNLDDKLLLSGYLHDLGVCLHFQEDDLLRKTVILKPIWGTDAVYKVLDNPKVIENRGHFDRSDLANIWHEEKYALMQPELLQLMKNFKLCYEIPSRPNTFIAPHLLAADQPDYDWDNTDNLILRYEYDFMPKGILTRFIVELNHLIENQALVWKNGVVLNNDRARAEIQEYYRSSNGEIRIRVSGNGRKELLNIINHEFKKIHDSYERLQYNTLIPCNCDLCTTHKPHEYTLKELERYLDRNRPTIECRESFEQVNIRRLIDDVLPNTRTAKSSIQNTIRSSAPLRDRVFISYSHKDDAALAQLQTHLKPLIRKSSLQIWDDTQIEAGDEWRQKIDSAISSAKVAVLLVSPDFLASDFIADHELPPFLDAAKNEGLTILWIPYRSSNYEVTEIANYQAAHPPAQPLSKLSPAEQDDAWVKICKKIQAAADNAN